MPRKAKYPGESKEQQAQRRRENGRLGGRPKGSGSGLPVGAIEALRVAKFRVKKDLPANVANDAAEIAGIALDRTVQVLMGRVHSRKAPSVLKAAIQIREEICEPVVKEAKVSGSLSLAQIVAAAATTDEDSSGA